MIGTDSAEGLLLDSARNSGVGSTASPPLIELIQDAHDAHPKGSEDGWILVLLDETEGDFGTLYVANGGHPLSEDNCNAILSVALSDKPLSEGIGIKGVGFKSVLQFSDRPEVYSKPTSGSRAMALRDTPAHGVFDRSSHQD